jgi:hypothetical protein
MKRLILGVGALALSAVGFSQVLFTAGFEASEGYTLGNIAGQNGWTGDNPSIIANVIDTNASAGSRALQVTGASWWWPTFSYNHSTSANKILRVKWDMYVPATQSAGIDIYTDLVQRVAAMRVLTNGNVGFIHFVGGTSQQAVDTGVAVTASTWNSFRMELDFAAGTWKGFLNGVQVGPTATIRTGISTIITDADVQGISATNASVFDEYSVEAVPEPTAMVALAGGALALLRRRRK